MILYLLNSFLEKQTQGGCKTFIYIFARAKVRVPHQRTTRNFVKMIFKSLKHHRRSSLKAAQLRTFQTMEGERPRHMIEERSQSLIQKT